MNLREAIVGDIKQIQRVRNSVKENMLSDPNLVSDQDCEEFITKRGKGWVYQIEDQIVGFSIIGLQENNVWALFVHPDFDRQGIGKQLHDVMLNWYFSKTVEHVWLGTAPNTRAETFYRKLGWTEIGTHGKGEVKFQMTAENWKILKSDQQ
ncbi:GNAT family N-acetyltransferase [Sphingobacterium sp. SRCM116780]|uniref:GNAT family N-acetyltransferase n=1 Tax=Sphingobacterium sp. SRCM116780 TaxID=2907623 RepID=UPI001F305551|nr:GNAT family N-acetyltransferase [Sphingobacterium sp. SRCM116780]UIR57959.1 GNAT family N-acetyltransferase [Sphingobacterium sp. SRCM116780]